MTARTRVVLVTGLVGLLVGAATIVPAPAQTPRRGGVFRVPVADAPGLDPHQSAAFMTHVYASLVYGQLVRFPSGAEAQGPGDHRILPDLAEKRWCSGCARACASTVSRRWTGARSPPRT
jgi:hypothetical protein